MKGGNGVGVLGCEELKLKVGGYGLWKGGGVWSVGVGFGG